MMDQVIPNIFDFVKLNYSLDADNTCKMPFFLDGIWYENCTLYPRDKFWCPTEVDPTTREQRGWTADYFSSFNLVNILQMRAPGVTVQTS